LVGFGGFLVQISTIALLTRASGWPALGATAVALELAALVNFVGHSSWTWRDRPEHSGRGVIKRYWRYQAAKTTSLLANLAITTTLTSLSVPPELANTAAVLACAIPNYFISEHLVFVR
jgi:putative flippase GtrA